MRDIYRAVWWCRMRDPTGSGLADIDPNSRDEGRLVMKGAFYCVTTTLYRLLEFELMSVPRDRLRLCRRSDCKHPYFIARHGSQQYCSRRCANWAQENWRKAYYVNTWAERRRQIAATKKNSRKSSRRKRG